MFKYRTYDLTWHLRDYFVASLLSRQLELGNPNSDWHIIIPTILFQLSNTYIFQNTTSRVYISSIKVIINTSNLTLN